MLPDDGDIQFVRYQKRLAKKLLSPEDKNFFFNSQSTQCFIQRPISF